MSAWASSLLTSCILYKFIWGINLLLDYQGWLWRFCSVKKDYQCNQNVKSIIFCECWIRRSVYLKTIILFYGLWMQLHHNYHFYIYPQCILLYFNLKVSKIISRQLDIGTLILLNSFPFWHIYPKHYIWEYILEIWAWNSTSKFQIEHMIPGSVIEDAVFSCLTKWKSSYSQSSTIYSF